MVTPFVGRRAVAHLCQSFEVSQRRACQVIEADRTSMRQLCSLSGGPIESGSCGMAAPYSTVRKTPSN